MIALPVFERLTLAMVEAVQSSGWTMTGTALSRREKRIVGPPFS